LPNEAALIAWLIAVAIGSAAFLLFVPAGYAVTETRRLRAAGANRAALIVWKRLAGPVARSVALRLRDAGPPVDLSGASVWLEWDQRWGTHGACMGRVLRHVSAEAGSSLLIETAAPQALPDGPASTVLFAPRSARELQMHRVAAVRGTMRGHDAADAVDCQLATTVRTGS
jgi:hypothetical protein